MNKLFLSASIFSLTLPMFSQGIGVNNTGTDPNPNAILDADVSTNDKGILIPRITSGQRVGIGGLGAADEGLTVYDETTNSYWLWDGAQWVQFMMQGTAWALNGNAGTTPGTDYVGTSDAQDLVFKTNNAERVRVYTAGQMEVDDLGGVGTRMVVADANGVLGTQTLPPNGDITGVTAGAGLVGGGTAGTVTLTAAADNGLYVNAGADRVRMGGPLVEATTISHANFTLIHDLTGTGDFAIEDAGTRVFEVRDDGTTRIGDDMYWLDATTGGTLMGVFSDDGDDGRFRMYENGAVSMDLDMNSQFIFNEQGLDRNFRVESDGNANMVLVDAGTNRVGIGTATLSQTLDINGNADVNSGTYFVRDNAGATYGVGYATEGGTEMTIFADQYLDFTESDADVLTMRLDLNTQEVGIRTNAPTRALDVNGTVRIRGGAPTAGDFLMSQDANGNAAWSNAGYGLIPIGSIVGWHGNLTGVPALPAGWMECNGQTVADGASPLNGRVLPNLNGGTTSESGDASRGRFLRGNTTSGLYQTDQANNLDWINNDDSGNGDTNDYLDDDGTVVTIRAYNTSGDRFQANLDGLETRVTNMSVRWIIRIK